MVIAKVSFNDDLVDVQYNETDPNYAGWKDFAPSNFGPVSVFSFTEGLKSKFKVTFVNAGQFDVNITINVKDDGTELATYIKTIIISEPVKAEIVVNKADSFKVNEPSEFTVATVVGDNQGKTVKAFFEYE